MVISLRLSFLFFGVCSFTASYVIQKLKKFHVMQERQENSSIQHTRYNIDNNTNITWINTWNEYCDDRYIQVKLDQKTQINDSWIRETYKLSQIAIQAMGWWRYFA